MCYSLHRSSHKGHGKEVDTFELWQGSTTVYTPSKHRYRFLLSASFKFLLVVISHLLGKGPSGSWPWKRTKEYYISVNNSLVLSMCRAVWRAQQTKNNEICPSTQLSPAHSISLWGRGRALKLLNLKSCWGSTHRSWPKLKGFLDTNNKLLLTRGPLPSSFTPA